jgi:hypothetical protein
MLFAPGTCPERPRSDYALAVGDVCGNAFQVCLFLIADRRNAKQLARRARHRALSRVRNRRRRRPLRCHFRLGPDFLLVIVLFAVGIAGLFVLPH